MYKVWWGRIIWIKKWNEFLKFIIRYNKRQEHVFFFFLLLTFFNFKHIFSDTYLFRETVSFFVSQVFLTIKFHAALTERKSTFGYKKYWLMCTASHIARVFIVFISFSKVFKCFEIYLHHSENLPMISTSSYKNQ